MILRILRGTSVQENIKVIFDRFFIIVLEKLKFVYGFIFWGYFYELCPTDRKKKKMTSPADSDSPGAGADGLRPATSYGWPLKCPAFS